MSSHAFADAVKETSAEQREIIVQTLRSMLESHHFSKSKRYPAFLEFVVLNALEHEGEMLKERTVGIRVFGRPLDYDTSSDPVVRIAAGEVRRRMALYFSEHPESPVRIDLPVGSYLADFHFPDTSWPDASPTSEEREAGQFDAGSLVAPAERPRRRWLARYSWSLAVAALVLLPLCGIGVWRYQRVQAKNEFWAPVLQGQGAWQILVGRSKLPPSVGAKNRQEEIAYGPSGPPNLPLDDAIVVGQICGLVRQYGRDCDILPGQPALVENLLKKPVVVVGGFNNPWADLLLGPLPYRLRMDKVNHIRYVIEHRPGGDAELGRIDDADPSLISKDYAIIARFHCTMTDSVAVVIAGAGIPGTRVAGQYVTSPEKLREILSLAPKNWDGTNLEAVLRVDVVQGTPGHAEVMAARFW